MAVQFSKAPEKAQPKVQRDYFPMFLYNGDDLVEIVMVESSVTDDGFTMSLGTFFEDSPSEITRVVYEGPIGCYEAFVYVPKGGTVDVVPEGQGATWHPCIR